MHGGSSPRGLQPPSRGRPHHGAAVTGKSEYVTLVLKRNRGWPWPESAFMDSMYGEGGWCHRCGTPLVEQNGPVVLQKRARPVKGAWVPHWAWESFCVDLDLADRIERDLPEVEFLDVLHDALPRPAAPRKSGRRFSWRAARPSAASGPRKFSISYASDASKFGSAWRSQ